LRGAGDPIPADIHIDLVLADEGLLVHTLELDQVESAHRRSAPVPADADDIWPTPPIAVVDDRRSVMHSRGDDGDSALSVHNGVLM
jgi:hypothetical protein